MDSSKSISGIIVMVCAVIMALWLGVSLVTSQTETVAYIGAASLLITCIFLGRKIWLLFVLFTALGIPLIRGISTIELGQALFIGFTIVIFLMRRLPTKFTFGEKEFWVLLITASVAQVYFRNPAGLNIFGAGSVGGRPYFVFALSLVSSVILASMVVPASQIKWAARLTWAGILVGSVFTAIRMRGVGDAGGYERNAKMSDGRDSSRISVLTNISLGMARPIAAKISPLRALLHPIWGPLMIITVGLAALSGYRNTVANVGLIYLVGLAYRGGAPAVVFSVVSGAMGLGLLAVVNVMSPLPPNIQRALSPFPGTWEERYVTAADESTEWRVEMWKEALFTDYWIHDKIFGDGLGFTAKEFELISAVEDGGGSASNNSGMTAQQEALMITGGYHSGPVQTVRIVGYVGLLILLLAMIRMAVHAHRQIVRCRGTEWFPYAIFLGTPSIVLPIMFVFIFGDFTRDVTALLFSYAMIRLMEANIPLPAYRKPKRLPFILTTGGKLASPMPQEATSP